MFLTFGILLYISAAPKEINCRNSIPARRQCVNVSRNPIMRRVSLAIVCLISTISCWSQKDSLIFDISVTPSEDKSIPEFCLNLQIKSNYKQDLAVPDSINEVLVFCPDLSPLSIEIQKLDSNCYVSHPPDCDPGSDFFERNHRTRILKQNDILKYRFRIDTHFER